MKGQKSICLSLRELGDKNVSKLIYANANKYIPILNKDSTLNDEIESPEIPVASRT